MRPEETPPHLHWQLMRQAPTRVSPLTLPVAMVAAGGITMLLALHLLPSLARVWTRPISLLLHHHRHHHCKECLPDEGSS